MKCIYKIKFNEDNSKQKLKAHLVAKGYSQQSTIWLKTLLCELEVEVVSSYENSNNNQEATHIVSNPVFHENIEA